MCLLVDNVVIGGRVGSLMYESEMDSQASNKIGADKSRQYWPEQIPSVLVPS